MGLGDFLGAYGQARRQKITQDRDKEDRDRALQMRIYQDALDRADELGLTEDDLRVMFNQVGTLFGHKPDPKLFGLFSVGDKGSKGRPDLGDMLFPTQRRDAQVITGSRPGTPTTEEGPGRSIEDRIGPPPEMITARRGEVPVRQLKQREQLAMQKELDYTRTQNDIEQANSIASRTIQTAVRPDGSLAYFRQEFDPTTKQMKLINVTPEEGLRSTQQVVTEMRNTKEFNEELNLLKQDPNFADLPEEVLRATAAKTVMDKRAAELAKTKARTAELVESAKLKRARTSQILDPKMTPYQQAQLGLQEKRIELEAARLAVSQNIFDKTRSQDLVKNLDAFYDARTKALEYIEEGNQAQAKQDLVTATSKWRLGYMMLSQAKIMAEALKANYGEDMVTVVNTDPNDRATFPWVEVNYDLPSKLQTPSKGGGKRPFKPSKTVAPEMREQYKQWLINERKLSPEDAEKRVIKELGGPK